MKILIIGASTAQSIGYQVGERLRVDGHIVLYSSRRSKLQDAGMCFQACDVTKPRQTEKLFKTSLPEVIIYAAGVFSNAQALGSIKDWSAIHAHLQAKSIGAIATLNAAVRIGMVQRIIFLGGREISAHEGYGAYTCGNGAMWALVKFAARHIRTITAHYIYLPMVIGSTMANRYLEDPAKKDSHGGAVSIEEVSATIESILEGKHDTKNRIVLGEEWNV